MVLRLDYVDTRAAGGETEVLEEGSLYFAPDGRFRHDVERRGERTTEIMLPLSEERVTMNHAERTAVRGWLHGSWPAASAEPRAPRSRCSRTNRRGGRWGAGAVSSSSCRRFSEACPEAVASMKSSMRKSCFGAYSRMARRWLLNVLLRGRDAQRLLLKKPCRYPTPMSPGPAWSAMPPSSSGSGLGLGIPSGRCAG